MFKLFKRKQKENKKSFVTDVRYRSVTYTVYWDNLEYMKEFFKPEKILHISYNTKGKYFTVIIEVGD